MDIAAVVSRQSHLASGEEPNSTADQIRRARAGGEVWQYEVRDELVFEEISVSGGRSLDERPGLLPAVEAIEAKVANVLVVTYYDRLARSLMTTENVIARVENAGGRVIALDAGPISHKTAAQWQAATYPMVAAEAYRRTIGERTHHAKERAVSQGILIYKNVPFGYVRGDGKKLVVDKPAAELVVRAFTMRDEGRTIDEVRAMIQTAGYEISYSRVEKMFRSRIYLGEFRWGSKEEGTLIENLHFCEPIVDRVLFERVQSARIAKGRKPKSPRLLARLGILRCSGCGGRMGIANGSYIAGPEKRMKVYRCHAHTGDCPRRVTIGADLVEDHLLSVCEEIIEGMQGRASADLELEAARAKAEEAQRELDQNIATLSAAGLMVEPTSVDLLTGLRTQRDDARLHYDRLVALSERSIETVAAGELRSLPMERQRKILSALVRRVTIAPGVAGHRDRERSIARIDVDLFEEETFA